MFDYPEQKQQVNGYRVLVVEDDKVSAEIASRFLTGLGCRVDWASNAKMALRHMSEQRYDLIFIDIGLPDMDGYSLVQQIRQTADSKNRQVPIIALTAYGDEETARKCLAIGMNASLVKPLLKTTAQSILERFIPEWRRHNLQIDEGKIEQNPQFTDSHEAIKFQQALALHQGDVFFIKNALSIVMSSFETNLNELALAFKGQNWGEMGVIIHKMSGVTSYFCMPRLEQTCKQLTLKLHAGSISHEDYAELLHNIREVQNCYEQWIKDERN